MSSCVYERNGKRRLAAHKVMAASTSGGELSRFNTGLYAAFYPAAHRLIDPSGPPDMNTEQAKAPKRLLPLFSLKVHFSRPAQERRERVRLAFAEAVGHVGRRRVPPITGIADPWNLADPMHKVREALCVGANAFSPVFSPEGTIIDRAVDIDKMDHVFDLLTSALSELRGLPDMRTKLVLAMIDMIRACLHEVFLPNWEAGR